MNADRDELVEELEELERESPAARASSVAGLAAIRAGARRARFAIRTTG